ncbi:MAG: RNA pyrophosphohydrolase [Cucumibacter sp.]
MKRRPVREGLPYRPCAGAAVFNQTGEVFIGRRLNSGDEESGAWQMPQGGLDPGEAPLDGARRELFEETNINSVSLIAPVDGWINYDLPDELIGVALKGNYRGQTQRWFAFRFEGSESEIDVQRPGGGKHKPEFESWRWAALEDLPGIVVPFKREAYLKIVAALRPLAANLSNG